MKGQGEGNCYGFLYLLPDVQKGEQKMENLDILCL